MKKCCGGGAFCQEYILPNAEGDVKWQDLLLFTGVLVKSNKYLLKSVKSRKIPLTFRKKRNKLI